MKFLVFNLVVGAALAYLIVADGRRSSRDTESDGIRAARTMAGPSASVGLPSAPHDGARLVATPGPSAQVPPIPSVGADLGGSHATSVTDLDAPVVNRPLSTPAALVDQRTGSVGVDGEMTTRGLSTLSAAERGRQLHDIAREMEDRFLSGVR